MCQESIRKERVIDRARHGTIVLGACTNRQNMSQTLQAIRGMNDILPVDAELWEQFFPS